MAARAEQLQNRFFRRFTSQSYSPQFFPASHVDQRARSRCAALYISALVFTYRQVNERKKRARLEGGKVKRTPFRKISVLLNTCRRAAVL